MSEPMTRTSFRPQDIISSAMLSVILPFAWTMSLPVCGLTTSSTAYLGAFLSYMSALIAARRSSLSAMSSIAVGLPSTIAKVRMPLGGMPSQQSSSMTMTS